MSILVQTKVWDKFPDGGTELLVALAMADFSHDDGTGIWPSVDTLSDKCRCSVRQVQRIIKKMLADGFLILVAEENTKRKTREYSINLEYLMDVGEQQNTSVDNDATVTGDNISGVTFATHTPDICDTVPPTPMSPDPLYNHQEPLPIAEPKGSTVVDQISEVINFLNKKSNRSFSIKNPKGKLTANAEQVRARLKDGYTVQDCKTVIAKKVRDWSKKDDMVQYLTPETLFRKSKFEKYLGECV